MHLGRRHWWMDRGCWACRPTSALRRRCACKCARCRCGKKKCAGSCGGGFSWNSSGKESRERAGDNRIGAPAASTETSPVEGETKMAQIGYEEVNLMLRLYDMRREARLRQARAWFVEHFHPESPEEMMQRYPQGGEENTYIRMVISYWDMVAGIVNRGLINDELFFDSNGEIWVVWDRMRSIVPTWRAAFQGRQSTR